MLVNKWIVIINKNIEGTKHVIFSIKSSIQKKIELVRIDETGTNRAANRLYLTSPKRHQIYTEKIIIALKIKLIKD